MINIHPIIVHFPIALLSIYVLFEIISVLTNRKSTELSAIKKAFLYFGVVGAWFASMSGELLEESFGETPLIETHSLIATTSIIIFSIIAGAYLVPFLGRYVKNITKINIVNTIWRILDAVSLFVLHPVVRVSIALLGFITLLIAGALGGAIAHGPDTDPFIQFIYNAFGF